MTSAHVASSGDAGRPQLGLVLLLVLPLLVGIGLAIGVAVGVHGGRFNVLALALIMGAVALVPLILDVRRPYDRRHILLSFTSLAYLVLFVLSVFTSYFFATSMTRLEDLSIGDLATLRPDEIVRGQLTALAGFLLLLAGYSIPIGRMVPGGIPTPRRNWTYGTMLAVAFVMIPVGWALYVASAFGILPRRAGSGFLGAISNSTYMGIALLMLAYLRRRSREVLFVMLLLIPASMAFNFLGGSKTAVLSPPAVVAVAYIVVYRRIALRWVAAALALVIIIYPIAEFQRRVVLKENTQGIAYALMRPFETLSKLSRFATSWELGDYVSQGFKATSRRSDGLGILSVILRDCPSRVPFQGGWTLGYIALSYVPRLVWVDKPDMTTGQWVTDNFGGGPSIRSSTAPTWIGELYFNFGWPGIVFGMLFMGLFMRTLHEMLFLPNAPVPTQIMAVVVLFAFPQTMQMALIGPINSVVFGALPLVFTHWMVRLLGGAPATASGDSGRHRFASDVPAGA